MIYSMYDKIYKGLKQYVGENSIYSPHVLKKPKETIFPLVVFSITNDVNTLNQGYFDQISTVSFAVEISTINLEKDGEEIDSMQVAHEIHKHIEIYLGCICRYTKVLDNPTPNIDTNVYRIVMRYTVKINTRRNIIY